MIMDQIIHRSVVFATPWFRVIAKKVKAQQNPHYSLQMLDYVSVVAVTRSDEIVLVRQYRPVVERYTLELPSGHVEPNETPEQAARRELLEETGFRADYWELLGTLAPDTGRLENRLWCFFASDLQRAPGHPGEPGIETIRCAKQDFFELIARVEFDHAQNLAALFLALSKRGKIFFE
jgi:ADP-ribose pyrophosphatase